MTAALVRRKNQHLTDPHARAVERGLERVYTGKCHNRAAAGVGAICVCANAQRVACCGDTAVKIISRNGMELEMLVEIPLDRKASLMDSMTTVASEDGVDQVLLFVVDILNEEATLLVPNDLVKTVAKKSFDADATGDTVVLPGVMSRKKQIIPNLKV